MTRAIEKLHQSHETRCAETGHWIPPMHTSAKVPIQKAMLRNSPLRNVKAISTTAGIAAHGNIVQVSGISV